jgi:hypothetical protein
MEPVTQRIKLKCFSGDPLVFFFEFFTDEEMTTPEDITGNKLVITLKESLDDSDDDAIFHESFSASDAANGQISGGPVSDDTIDLEGDHHFSAVILKDGQEYTELYGIVTFVKRAKATIGDPV